MRNQRGITLVALVVTIVVLLILAGTSIAMLKGDNGIITNAQKSSYANIESEAMDKIKMAFNTIATEVRVKSATELNYDATAKVAELADLALVDLGGTKGTITGTATSNTGTAGNYTVKAEAGKITITYSDNTVFKTSGKYNPVEYTITITSDSASLSDYARQVQ